MCGKLQIPIAKIPVSIANFVMLGVYSLDSKLFSVRNM
ncbi:hypothetical protein BD31_I0969 [Candidatus Nitrosopumilus salaria BD31]|uniref:Uncharacterized protein n=1 Tax=Candidatus Nitrosopumilus salarius BD31 TaxID=859350 RepID=I3D3V0_9ARCH|nr:hypothetical protein BD31_I0969 [Candidatus Nitrosopumilus salaria BD31]